MQAQRCHLFGQVKVDHPWLHPSNTILFIDFENPIHARRGDDNGIAERGGPAAQAGSGTSGKDCTVVSGGDLHDRLHMLGGVRKADRSRGAVAEHRGVGAGEMSSCTVSADPVLAKRTDQFSNTRIGVVLAGSVGPSSSTELHSSTFVQTPLSHRSQAGAVNSHPKLHLRSRKRSPRIIAHVPE